MQGVGPTVNLGRAATAVVASTTRVAALVSEPAQGASILNGDGDALDQVLQVYSIAGAAWSNVGYAADALAISGDHVAFITPEAAQGGPSLNGDVDTDDRVVQVYDAATATRTNLGLAAEELVLGEPVGTVCGPHHLMAFRSLEAAEGNADQNGDGDTLDGVLVVYDLTTDTTYALGEAVTPCRLEACDPRAPYRVNGGEVRFLTFESDQSQDLDGNGVIGGLVLQNFDICTGAVTVVGAVDPESTSDPLKIIDDGTAFTTPAGRCATDPACSVPADCPVGIVLQRRHRILHAHHPADLPYERQRLPVRRRLHGRARHGRCAGARQRRRRRSGRARQLPRDRQPGASRRRSRQRRRCLRRRDVDALSRCSRVAIAEPRRCSSSRRSRSRTTRRTPRTRSSGSGQAVPPPRRATSAIPLRSDAYRLCIYEGPTPNATLRTDVRFAPGGVCDGKPCWKALGKPAGAKGFQYKSKTRGSLALKPGIDGKAQIKLVAKGAAAILPPLPARELPTPRAAERRRELLGDDVRRGDEERGLQAASEGAELGRRVDVTASTPPARPPAGSRSTIPDCCRWCR